MKGRHGGARPDMRMPILFLLIILTTTPVRAQEKEDIPDPVCDGGTSDLVKCLAGATAKWDKRLNAAYRDALKDKETPVAQREQLRKAQRLWLQYRDANCDYYALSEGSIARVNAASCLFDMTKARAKELGAGPQN
jgi:uncharacterized protein YecT (DUF1311 family)